jgi:hypothetical protein
LLRGLTSKTRVMHGVRFLMVAILVVLVSYVVLFPQLFRSQIICFSDFQSPFGRVFLAPQIPVGHREWVLLEIAQAKSRIDSMYDGHRSDPTVIVCATPEQYEQYCNSSEGAGCSLGTPWGSSYVIVNLNGVNTDVISHELSHTELLARLGWWNVTFNIPQWFNEGVALMADRRFVKEEDPVDRYRAYMDEWLYQTGGAQIILELDEIRTLQGFFKGNSKHVMTAYMTAGLEVSFWVAHGDKDPLSLFLDRMASGYSFADAYAASGNGRSKKYLPPNPLRRNSSESSK